METQSETVWEMSERTHPSDETQQTARSWAGALADGESLEPPNDLVSWTKDRMDAYAFAAQGCWDRESMAEWISYDLNISENKAFELCSKAKFPHGSMID